ncbi:hypothetical protein U1Q18_019610 [Sarracenia purpurea var. burkii]
MHEASQLLERMVNRGVKPTVVTYSILIEQMLKEYAFDDAQKVFDQMVSLGYKPDVCTYTSFLLAYYNRDMLTKAEDVMTKMNEDGVHPDLMTYTVLIDGYARGGFINQAFDIFKCMVDAGCDPSHYTYSVLIKHLSKEKWLMESTTRTGENVTSINIADVWKIMEFDTALVLFDKMIEHGCTPNVNTYGALTTGLCIEGRFEEAWRLVDHMKKRGLSPTEDM